MSSVLKGTVKFFDSKKGWGFILVGEGDKQEEIFVHFSAIRAEGFKTLHQDDEVEFEIAENEKGVQAMNVVVTKKAQKRSKAKANDGDTDRA